MLGGDLENAEKQAEAACERNDNTYLPRVVLAVVQAKGSDINSARATHKEAYRIKPDLSIEEIDGIVGKRLRDVFLALS
jgi:Tfp pilus assembly protein PilF